MLLLGGVADNCLRCFCARAVCSIQELLLVTNILLRGYGVYVYTRTGVQGPDTSDG